ncbi:hypothetical protein Lepto1489_18690 [Leptospira interrogans serovar Bataviae]|uniref:SLEI domain protein, PF07620 family n=1 Tax=Leptospira interrogans serovar Bataviae TaxID=312175 RepID=A0AAQ0B458_LEPIR|nr:hypothetical protein [Leptospira interrogans serovar Yeoncheon]OOB95677.1 hypothetical protein B0191_06010 [Leptospira interrogans serovar Hardjo]OOC00178.1 hypothetical protein B0192_01555 [Leptospira interrogans serovar Australis]QOI35926.1 hypothetical protein LeptoLang_18075 [Leptospira interrogans serovar Icterohaemorrhagiae]QOI39992.1 hypothetical protein Lepto1548_18160 [Leptospira interrogans serovar Bataviae]
MSFSITLSEFVSKPQKILHDNSLEIFKHSFFVIQVREFLHLFFIRNQFIKKSLRFYSRHLR